MCNIPNCTQDNCIHEKVSELKERVSKKLDLAEKHRYKWKEQKTSDLPLMKAQPKLFASSRRG